MSVLSDISAPAVTSDVAARFLHIVASGDSSALLDLFTESAVVRDWGHLHVGRSAIASWNDREFLGADVVLDVHRVVEVDDRVTVTATVTGATFCGPSTFVLRPEGSQLRELIITA